jgi:hypothetical protein
MMRELGFQRRGKNVVARLTAAITRSAPNPPGHYGVPRRLHAAAPRASREAVCSEQKGWFSRHSATGTNATRTGE